MRFLAVAIFAGVAAPTALCDNAALTSGGLPTMLKAHKSVTMESEVVKITIHWDRVDVDCSFVFVNHGPSCEVNMGFPDFGLWAYADGPPSGKRTPHTMFKSYRSSVDGRMVKTKLVLGKNPGEQWQTQQVSFPKDAKRIVREVYTTDVGGVAVSSDEVWAFASYLLHTGSSWNGNIGTATVIATFAPDSQIALPLRVSFGDFRKTDAKTTSAQLAKPGGVIVSGMSKPDVKGRSLTFTRSNWKPAQTDDIYVGYLMPKDVLDKHRKKAGQHHQEV
jgi:hypothetical protein